MRINRGTPKTPRLKKQKKYISGKIKNNIKKYNGQKKCFGEKNIIRENMKK